MDWFLEFWDYILGCILFTGLCYFAIKSLDKTIISFAAEIGEFTVKQIKKRIPKKPKTNNDTKERDKDKEVEVDLEIQAQMEQDVYLGQEGLEVLPNEDEIENKKRKKKKKRIIGFNKQAVRGQHSANMVKEQINKFRNIDLNMVQDQGVFSAVAKAEKQQRGQQKMQQYRGV